MQAKEAALQVLFHAQTPEGFLASSEIADNYAHVWSRDSMMTGIATVLFQEEKLLPTFRASIVSLANYQNEVGQIPSNLKFLANGEVKVSYGGLVGRVDAITWWIIGASIYLNYTQDSALKKTLLPKIEKAFQVLKIYEFNGRGLMYVPLGANWADEYVTEGYTLYDQLLRFWALQAAAKVWNREDWHTQAHQLKTLLETNYDYQPEKKEGLYHALAYHKINHVPYWLSSFSPAGYDERWDMPANALALLLNLGNTNKHKAVDFYLQYLAKLQGHWLLPVYAPTIFPNEKDWHLLKENYSYQFKNYPHHFHNGGAWFIFLGWLNLGLSKQGFEFTAQHIWLAQATMLTKEEPQPYTFYEYWNPTTLTHGGTPKLCFSAVGTLFSIFANDKEKIREVNRLLLID